MALKEQFEIPGGLKKWSYALMGVGVLTLILGVIFLHPFSAGHGEGHGAEAYGATKFWWWLPASSLLLQQRLRRQVGHWCSVVYRKQYRAV
jgi:hypothetical protein